jgi:hypothetical protein
VASLATKSTWRSTSAVRSEALTSQKRANAAPPTMGHSQSWRGIRIFDFPRERFLPDSGGPAAFPFPLNAKGHGGWYLVSLPSCHLPQLIWLATCTCSRSSLIPPAMPHTVFALIHHNSQKTKTLLVYPLVHRFSLIFKTFNINALPVLSGSLNHHLPTHHFPLNVVSMSRRNITAASVGSYSTSLHFNLVPVLMSFFSFTLWARPSGR